MDQRLGSSVTTVTSHCFVLQTFYGEGNSEHISHVYGLKKWCT